MKNSAQFSLLFRNGWNKLFYQDDILFGIKINLNGRNFSQKSELNGCGWYKNRRKIFNYAMVRLMACIKEIADDFSGAREIIKRVLLKFIRE